LMLDSQTLCVSRGSAPYQQSSQETPLSSKRTLDDLWDRTDVDPLKPDEAPFAF
jgi:hypothetical protein